MRYNESLGKYIEVDSTAFLRILGYKGYKKGSPFDCTIDSNPRDVSGNVVYNFSYYNPDEKSREETRYKNYTLTLEIKVLIWDYIIRRQDEETFDIVSCDWSIGGVRTDN
ncbi:MAG: hypothetical protein AB7T10_00960 [bacterium]